MHPKENIPALTGLRFFAALGILLHHGVGFRGLDVDPFVRYFLASGVSFFFVLSGFVLALNYGSLEKQERRLFYLRRFIRIFPTHWFITLLFTVACWPFVSHYVSYYLGDYWPPVLGANLLLVQTWIPVPITFFSFNGPSWSISCEIAFYLLFPFLVPLWRRSPAFLATFGGLSCLVIVAAASPLPPFGVEFLGTWEFTSTGFTQFWPLARLFEFILGMVAARAYVDLRCQFDARGLVTVRLFEAGALLIAFVAGAFIFFQKSTVVSALPKDFAVSLTGWINQSGLCLSMALLIFAISLPGSLGRKFLGGSVLVVLGEASYALYLVHIPVKIFLNSHPDIFGSMPDALVLSFYILGSILLSISIWKFFEVPVRRFLLHRMEGKVS